MPCAGGRSTTLSLDPSAALNSDDPFAINAAMLELLLAKSTLNWGTEFPNKDVEAARARLPVYKVLADIHKHLSDVVSHLGQNAQALLAVQQVCLAQGRVCTACVQTPC